MTIILEKHWCEYCHGNTYDDERGNCTCCGAPRKKEFKTIMYYPLYSGLPNAQQEYIIAYSGEEHEH